MAGYSRRLALALALTAPLAALAQIAVGASGQASYAIGLAVPPGIAGMAPNLSLAYADGGINGPVGVGWSLQGVSMITRCAASKAVDGIANAVEFSGVDKLCLDGQRLIQSDDAGVPSASQANDALGLAGTATREYRTEKDSYARIRAYGQISTTAADGPAYFRVWTKSGLIYEYGRSPTSENDSNAVITVQGKKTVMVWAVRRVTDVLGNYMSFTYSQRDVTWGSGSVAAGAPGREWNLSEIRYTGTGSAGPSNKVVFQYEDRSSAASPAHDRSEAYQVGYKNVSVQRLKAIRSYVNTADTPVLVRTYKLSYERAGRTGRSRLKSVQECVGAQEDKCLPETALDYSDPDVASVQYAANANFSLDDLASTKLTNPEGVYGVITGDFNGDGLTDILRWGADVKDNKLFFSKGNGRFTAIAHNLNTSTDRLFSSDGCYSSTAADFNGDGLTDILRTSKSGCAAGSVLYLSTGSGSFTTVAVNSAINFTMKKSEYSSQPLSSCMPPIVPNLGPDKGRNASRPGNEATPASCAIITQTTGNRYYLLDADGDGFLDIVTTVLPMLVWNTRDGEKPTDSEICSGYMMPNGDAFSGPCTRVFLGSATGTFEELTTTNVRAKSLYSDPPAPLPSNPYWRRTDQADVNGDGLQDILAMRTGVWLSQGDGNFTSGSTEDGAQLCSLPIDFNGDARADCLQPDTAASKQSLTLSLGTSSVNVVQFNLTTDGNQLLALDEYQRQTLGVVIEDFDGDGRQDLLRWGPTSADNGIYLSNGDGSFRTRAAAGLTGIGRPLQSADGTTAFVLGDFLGTGTVQILHMKQNPPTSGGDVNGLNQLYARTGTPGAVDVLDSVTTPSGLVHSVKSRQALTVVGGRYATDRGTGNEATGNQVDLQVPTYVVTATTTDTGAGTLTTEYAYKGLKAERAGRGLLGFREMREQRPAPDGSSLTTVSQYVQVHPYIGLTSLVKTYRGGLTSTGEGWISQTTNAYCDKTSSATPAAAVAGSPPAPCTSSKKVQRPYLYQSIEEGKDLGGAVLPKLTTTSTYNGTGDPLTIKVVTTGTALDGSQPFTKFTENFYADPKTDKDNWILGRLTSARVTNTVPNIFNGVATSAGSSPYAADSKGSGGRPAPAALPPALQGVILQLLLDD